jgi:hypothetical protein
MKMNIGADNPWTRLPSDPPFVLPEDSSFVGRYNGKVKGSEFELKIDSLPEPFIGNPDTARLVLLNLNPGHSPRDVEDHRKPQIKEIILANLHHECSEYPFYAVHPSFQGTGVEEYWRQYTRELQEASQLSDRAFSDRVMVIEWFPYHSQKCRLAEKILLDSQSYSFALAKAMLRKEGVQVIGTRAKRYWTLVADDFNDVPFVRSQRPWITAGNMEHGVFKRLLEMLRK